MLMLNSKCNARCGYCYIPYKGARDSKEALETTRRLMSQGFRVTFSGSENLLDLRYLDCYKEAGQDYILTNGIIPAREPDIVLALKGKGISEVIISHNFDEGNRSIPDSAIEAAIGNVLSGGLKVCLSILITALNYQGLPELCRKAKALGAHRVRFFRYSKIGKASLDPSMVMDAEQESSFFKLLRGVRAYYQEDEFRMNLAAGFSPRPGGKGERLAQENLFCPAGRTLFAITPDNTVFGCPFTIGEGLDIGRLTPEGLEIFKDIGDGKRDNCLILSTI